MLTVFNGRQSRMRYELVLFYFLHWTCNRIVLFSLPAYCTTPNVYFRNIHLFDFWLQRYQVPCTKCFLLFILWMHARVYCTTDTNCLNQNSTQCDLTVKHSRQHSCSSHSIRKRNMFVQNFHQSKLCLSMLGVNLNYSILVHTRGKVKKQGGMKCFRFMLTRWSGAVCRCGLLYENDLGECELHTFCVSTLISINRI